MSQFRYCAGVLNAEDVPIDRIADEVETPFYCYSTAGIEENYAKFAGALADQDALVCYAVKANSNLAVINTLALQGAGADVVSEGELRRVLTAGVDPLRVVFSGVGKTQGELAYALDQGILQINVESASELDMLSEIASARGQEIDIALRVNPDVDAGTHAKITTGVRTSKFGIPIGDARELFVRASKLPGVRPVSLALHIGSQLTELAPFEAAFTALAKLLQALRGDGYEVHRLDLGGGLGVVYNDEAPPAVADYTAMVKRTVGHLGCGLIFEPGRFLVADAGVLVCQVLHVKAIDERSIVIVDAAMNDLARPALYGAYHALLPVREAPGESILVESDVVGPICESSDTFARSIPLLPTATGDLLVFSLAGAYGAVMASTYNTRRLVPEVMVRGVEFAVVRTRPDYDELLALEKMPQWHKRRSARGAA
jgi:diaminopimelate decarboxylase